MFAMLVLLSYLNAYDTTDVLVDGLYGTRQEGATRLTKKETQHMGWVGNHFAVAALREVKRGACKGALHCKVPRCDLPFMAVASLAPHENTKVHSKRKVWVVGHNLGHIGHLCPRTFLDTLLLTAMYP